MTAYNYNGIGHVNDESKNKNRNMYIAFTSKDNFTSDGTNVQQITDYAESDSESAGRCVIVPVDLNEGYLIWDLQERVPDYNGYKFVSTGKICYVRYYDNGTVSEIKTVEGDLSDCQPIMVNGKAVWYVTKQSEPAFYTLDDMGITATDTAPEQPPSPSVSPLPSPSPSPSSSPNLSDNQFSDVPTEAYYAQAVAWAVENKVTTGTGGGKFSPENPCTRGQIATFLWNAAG